MHCAFYTTLLRCHFMPTLLYSSLRHFTPDTRPKLTSSYPSLPSSDPVLSLHSSYIPPFSHILILMPHRSFLSILYSKSTPSLLFFLPLSFPLCPHLLSSHLPSLPPSLSPPPSFTTPFPSAQCVVVAFSSSRTWIFVSILFSMFANLVYPSMSSLVSKM